MGHFAIVSLRNCYYLQSNFILNVRSFRITILSYNGTFPFKRTIIIIVIIRITALQKQLLLLLQCMLETINYFVEWDILILDFWIK